MYNRYVPQPDGSFQRSRVESRRPPEKPFQPKPCKEPEQPPCPPPPPQSCREPEPDCHKGGNAAGFLQSLLPQNFDTGDLIVILLLLLLAGDCEENRSNALLTLVLYLFM